MTEPDNLSGPSAALGEATPGPSAAAAPAAPPPPAARAGKGKTRSPVELPRGEWEDPPEAADHQAENVLHVLERCAERAKAGGLSLQDALDHLGSAAYAFACVVLAVPFLQPIALGPLATVGAFSFLAVGWQLVRNQPSPKLPDAIGKKALPADQWQFILGLAGKLLRFFAKFCRPRLKHLVAGRSGRVLAGWVIIVGALLLAAPFPPGVPLQNLLPTMAILFAIFGLQEQDGVMTVLSVVTAVITLIYIAVLYTLFAIFGAQILTWAWEWLLGLFGFPPPAPPATPVQP